MNFRARVIVTAVAASAASLAFAGGASASQIKEVFLGSLGNDAFIELQMTTAGEGQVAGQKVRFFGADGSLQGESPPFPSNVDNAQSQRTILIGDTAVPGVDFIYDQFYETNSFLNPGGAACFTGSGDCVSWGNFVDISVDYTGTAGNPVAPAGIPVGSSITRKTSRGCKTLLEDVDDTNDSAADFTVTGTPTPRGNSQAPLEKPCVRVRCGGKLATIVGTKGRNVLRGTPGRDVIAGLGGRDTLRGRGGRDILCGGAGRDKLIGGKGKDKLLGGPGRDTQVQ